MILKIIIDLSEMRHIFNQLSIIKLKKNSVEIFIKKYSLYYSFIIHIEHKLFIVKFYKPSDYQWGKISFNSNFQK